MGQEAKPGHAKGISLISFCAVQDLLHGTVNVSLNVEMDYELLAQDSRRVLASKIAEAVFDTLLAELEASNGT